MKLWPDVALIIVIIGLAFNTAAISFINKSIHNLNEITKRQTEIMRSLLL